MTQVSKLLFCLSNLPLLTLMITLHIFRAMNWVSLSATLQTSLDVEQVRSSSAQLHLAILLLFLVRTWHLYQPTLHWKMSLVWWHLRSTSIWEHHLTSSSLLKAQTLTSRLKHWFLFWSLFVDRRLSCMINLLRFLTSTWLKMELLIPGSASTSQVPFRFRAAMSWSSPVIAQSVTILSVKTMIVQLKSAIPLDSNFLGQSWEWNTASLLSLSRCSFELKLWVESKQQQLWISRSVVMKLFRDRALDLWPMSLTWTS